MTAVYSRMKMVTTEMVMNRPYPMRAPDRSRKSQQAVSPALCALEDRSCQSSVVIRQVRFAFFWNIQYFIARSVTLLYIHRIPDHPALSPELDAIDTHSHNLVHLFLDISAEMRRHDAPGVGPEGMSGW